MAATKRKQQAQETRQKIIETGKMLFEAREPGAVSVDEIAEASGVSKGTFYHYFSSKSDFCFQLANENRGDFCQHAVGSEDLPLQERLYLFIDDWAESISRVDANYVKHWLAAISGESYSGRAGKSQSIQVDWYRNMSLVSNMVVVAQEKGSASEKVSAESVAYVVVNGMYGCLVAYSTADENFSLERSVESLKRAVDLLIAD